MNYKIAQFILTPPQKNRSTLEIYVAQPDANKEALAGKLFALIEIESIKAENLKIINFLINTLNHDYYQGEKMILRERVSSIKIEHIFESALAKTNKKLSEFLQTEKIRLNPNILNITIGVIYNDSLHFSNLGKNKAILIYKNKTEEAAKYKLADISEQAGGEAKKPINPAKLFSNVVSGQLPSHGYFLFANETLTEYLSTKQLTSIITTLPPTGAAEQIKNVLEKINIYVPFMGIIVKNTTGLEAAEIKIKAPAQSSTRASIENLLTTEEKTEELLTPSGLINARKWLPHLDKFFSRFGSGRAQKSAASAIALKDKIFAKKKPSWLSFAKIFDLLKKLLSDIIGLFVFIYKIVTDKKAMADLLNRTIFAFKNGWASAKNALAKFFIWHKNLSKINKALFSAFVICLIIFAANIGWQIIENKKVEDQLAISDLVSVIEQKQNQIDASLLYSNEEGAKKIIEEARGLLAELPQKTQEQKDQYERLSAKLRVQTEKISRVVKLEPTELANFSNLNANAKPNNIILSSGKIYAADAAQSAIYNIDPANKMITTVSLNSQNVSSLTFPSLDKDNNIYYLDAGRLIAIEAKTEKVSTLNINYPAGVSDSNVADIKQYNNRFYLTDKQNGQIYRFNKDEEKISGAADWLNANGDFADVASMDIDGSIYLLKKTGQILKYTKGSAEDFFLPGVEPAITQAVRISAAAEQNYIYILEPQNKRVVVFSKDGKFVNQYVIEKFNDLKDFQVDEKNKTMYFLNGVSVFSAEMNHL